MIKINSMGIPRADGEVYAPDVDIVGLFPVYREGRWIESTSEYYQQFYSMPIPVTIPQVLTPRQIRKVLTDSGLRTAVENMVATSTDYDLKDWWEYSLDYQRTHPKLIEAAYALSLTDAQIDELFIVGGVL